MNSHVPEQKALAVSLDSIIPGNFERSGFRSSLLKGNLIIGRNFGF